MFGILREQFTFNIVYMIKLNILKYIKEVTIVNKRSFALGILLIIFVLILNMTISTSSSYIVAAPEYPSKIRFDDFEEKRNRMEDIDEAFLTNVKKFSYESASVILKEQDIKSNSLYSPISLYMAFAMMAESSKGDTRQEILDAIHMNDSGIIGKETGKLFRKLYFHNEIGKLNLANSLWLNKDIQFNKEFLDRMATDYYSYSFHVDFDDKDTSKKISDWISENTGGKLGNSPKDFMANPEQVMVFLNTIYFYDEWVDRFNADKTEEDVFYLGDGSTIKCDFMNMIHESHGYVKADGYTSSYLSFKNGGRMVFILPDEGISPTDIISDSKWLSEAIDAISSEKSQFGKVIFKIPKFSYKVQLDLREHMDRLGIKSAFDINTADFTPLSKTKPLFVSEVKQSAAISIDERGCEATAFTQIDYAGSARPEGMAEMILDRPFIFVIIGEDECPLFLGVINNPKAD